MRLRIVSIMSALLVNSMMGAMFASGLDVSPVAGAVVMNVAGMVLGSVESACCLRAGVFTEIWTGELVKRLRGSMDGSWLDGVPDNSSIVNNDTIHLVDVGVDPGVLINNTTYPIPQEVLQDADIAVKLDKFQTKVTPITDDELYASSYDKMGRVTESHGNAIMDAKFMKAAHSLCATKNSGTTPVLATTGARDSATGRVKLCMQDVINLKRSLDKLKVPVTGRRLVLCPDHVNDLLETDQSFKEQYNIDRGTAVIGRLYGFEIFEYGGTPLYTTAGVKKAVGASASTGEFACSFAFYVPRVFKATGSTKMYFSAAEGDPENQANRVNFRHYFLAMPKKEDAGGVLYSAYKASE